MARNVDFVEKNVRADRDAVMELTQKYRSNATPTLVAGDRVIIGFQPEDYEAAIRGAGSQAVSRDEA